MTEEEFKTWDWHKAESVCADRDLSRANADRFKARLAQVEADFATAIKAKDEELAECRNALAIVDALQRENADLAAKIANMEGHPDVIATRKAELQAQANAIQKRISELE